MNTKALTDNSQSVLNAIASGKSTRDIISNVLNMTATAVSGSIRSLSSRGLIETSKNGSITTTPDALQYITKRTRKPRTGTKMEQARAVFQRHYSQGRPAVLSKLRDSVGLTEKGAVTYYQNLRVEAGIAPASLAHSKRPSIRTKLQKVNGRSSRQASAVH